jgi:hypothetical protein
MYDVVYAIVPADNIDTSNGDDDIDINDHTVDFSMNIGEE